MKRLRVLVTTGLALLVLAVGLTLRDWEQAMDLAESTEPRGPSLVMEAVEARGFNDQGRPEYRLRALAANRYDDPKTHTLMAMPALEISNGDERWQVNAEHGRVEGSNERIVLRDKVYGRRLVPRPPMELETGQLRYTPSSGEVVAPGDVLIRHEGSSTRAGSLRGRMTTNRVELRGGVETRYVPAS